MIGIGLPRRVILRIHTLSILVMVQTMASIGVMPIVLEPFVLFIINRRQTRRVLIIIKSPLSSGLFCGLFFNIIRNTTTYEGSNIKKDIICWLFYFL